MADRIRNIHYLDDNDLKYLKPEPWMLDALKMNPDYTSWGNDEDYMTSGDSHNWSSCREIQTISELYGLDDLNELINFYFQIVRTSHTCPECDNIGYNKETKKLDDDWYDFANTGRKWQYKLTQVEVDALWEQNRLRSEFKTKPTAEQVNAWARKDFGHDSINKWICVEARARHLGVWGKCPKCEGNGIIPDEEQAHLELQMWYIHPRKGASKGVLLKRVDKSEFNMVVNYLKEAQERNYSRFAKLNFMNGGGNLK